MSPASASAARHIPVLLNETIRALDLQSNDDVVDCTVGAGGHAAAILKRTAPSGRLLGFDLDEAALESARSALTPFGSRVVLVRGNYKEVGRVLPTQGFGPVQAALLDLGYSSIEIDDATRGFSFRFDGPLDMRFDRRQETTAATVVNGWTEDELTSCLIKYGEERYARRIAQAIVAARRRSHIIGTSELAEIIAAAVPGSYRRGPIHPATRSFQALRIAVNDELENVASALPELLDALAVGGRLAVISFHSLEDRLVKRFFRDGAKSGRLAELTRRPIVATAEEIAHNPRARSAKLRVARKLA